MLKVPSNASSAAQVKKICFRTFCAAAVLLIGAGLLLYVYCTSPVSNGPGSHPVVIPRGSRPETVAAILARHKVIARPKLFQLVVKLKKADQSLKYGEYIFARGMTPLQIIDKLVRGEVATHPVTIPEGSTLADIAQLVAGAGFAGGADLIAKTLDPQFIKRHGLTGSSLEGFLFPDTYRFSRNVRVETILATMIARFKQVFSEEERAAPLQSTLSARDIVILASLVEKETARQEEKALVAGVFANRLKKRMRLECDPTVLYGVRLEDPGFKGRLRKKHLRKNTPYNTYRNYGLPAGPICSPGRESIRAALNPADTDYLYFVSRNDGTHTFSKTLREHNTAVMKYQK